MFRPSDRGEFKRTGDNLVTIAIGDTFGLAYFS